MTAEVRCCYVATWPPHGNAVLLLGPFEQEAQAQVYVDAAQRMHRRMRPGSYGYRYGVAAWPGGTEGAPQGVLNQRMGWTAPSPPPSAPPLPWERPRVLPPYVKAEFIHGDGSRYAVTRISLDRVWFRQVRPDGTHGPPHQRPWGEFDRLVDRWVRHPLLSGR
jgi:hypothetical protein